MQVLTEMKQTNVPFLNFSFPTNFSMLLTQAVSFITNKSSDLELKSSILRYQSISIISYTYTTPIATKIFNYKKVRHDLNSEDFNSKPSLEPKPIFKLSTSIISVVKTCLQSDNDTSYLRGGLNKMWILKNANDLSENIQSMPPRLPAIALKHLIPLPSTLLFLIQN